jgi:acetyl-coenzyme A synthetase (EC 6.2.1.1)
MQPTAIDALLQETRVFPPSDEFVKQANISDPAVYDEAARDYEAFWAKHAEQCLHWFEKWHTTLEWNPPYAKWFIGGKLNACYNCVDRHAQTWRRTKAALIWEGEPGDERVLTYGDLHREVQKFANVLKSLGVQKGDRVCIYMPLIPEAAIAMLACARIGAPHSVVFGGFSADALADRIRDAQAKVLITADGGWRRGSIVPLKRNADDALCQTDSVQTVIV